VKTIFQPAQLFELLDALEFAGRKRGKFEQRVAAKGVKAQVLPVALVATVSPVSRTQGMGAREK
jgi:hypothetical protein